MYEIAKQFDFCYGHRVWSQKLKEGFSTDTSCACRHLHGHQGKIIVYLQAEKLTDGMVTDFKHLGWFKKWLDDVLDHKFIMDIEDPLLDHEIPHLYESPPVYMNQHHGHKYYYLDNYKHLPKPIQEKYEGMVFVPFVPTSENICKWIHAIVEEKMEGLGIKVSRVQFYETPKSQSNYYKQ